MATSFDQPVGAGLTAGLSGGESGGAGPRPSGESGVMPVRRAVVVRRIGAVVACLVAVSILGAVLPVSSALDLEYVVSLALFAVATNLLLGFGGMVSFGQGVFYGVGAYVVALGWMHHLLSFVEAMVLAPFAGAAVAFFLGLLALRTRRLYFALITLAFSQLGYTIVQDQSSFTGGSNGVFGAMLPNWLLDPRTAFFFVLVVSTLAIAVLWKVTASPFGLVLRAIRDNRERVDAMGVNVFAHQLAAFVISGFFCAIAGSLFVVYSQSAYPALMEWTSSGTPVFMAVIGGMYLFPGPIVGAFVYQLANIYLIEHTQDWQIILGVVLLAVVLLRPDGLTGSIEGLRSLVRRSGERARRRHRHGSNSSGAADPADQADPAGGEP